MNSETQMRLALAHRLLPAYTANPKLAALIVAGSVGGGYADRHSDLELNAFWHEPLTDAERAAIPERAGGRDAIIYPYEDNEYSAGYYIGEIEVQTSEFLTGTIDGYLNDVLVSADTTPEKQFQIAAIQYSVPLYGVELIEHWRARAATYPDALVEAMVRGHVEFTHRWYAAPILAERGDSLYLYSLAGTVLQQMMGVLLGLNRMYLPHPAYKWSFRLIERMALTPPDLQKHLQHVFSSDAAAAVTTINELLEETLMLVDIHLPQIDTTTIRYNLTHRRAIE